MDFFDIPMEGIQEPNELDKYISQAIEKVKDTIAWWWDHRSVYPRLSAMALDTLVYQASFLKITAWTCDNVILATSTAVERVFSQGRQALHFTQNWLSPLSIWATLCFGDWCHKNLVCMSDIVDAIHNKGKKRAWEEILSDNEA